MRGRVWLRRPRPTLTACKPAELIPRQVQRRLHTVQVAVVETDGQVSVNETIHASVSVTTYAVLSTASSAQHRASVAIGKQALTETEPLAHAEL